MVAMANSGGAQPGASEVELKHRGVRVRQGKLRGVLGFCYLFIFLFIMIWVVYFRFLINSFSLFLFTLLFIDT